MGPPLRHGIATPFDRQSRAIGRTTDLPRGAFEEAYRERVIDYIGLREWYDYLGYPIDQERIALHVQAARVTRDVRNRLIATEIRQYEAGQLDAKILVEELKALNEWAEKIEYIVDEARRSREIRYKKMMEDVYVDAALKEWIPVGLMATALMELGFDPEYIAQRVDYVNARLASYPPKVVLKSSSIGLAVAGFPPPPVKPPPPKPSTIGLQIVGIPELPKPVMPTRPSSIGLTVYGPFIVKPPPVIKKPSSIGLQIID